MIQRMRSNLWIIAIHATLIPFVFFFCLLSWSIGAALPAVYAATWISAGCTLVGLAAIVLDGVCHHYGIGERMHAFFDRCEPVKDGIQYRLVVAETIAPIDRNDAFTEWVLWDPEVEGACTMVKRCNHGGSWELRAWFNDTSPPYVVITNTEDVVSELQLLGITIEVTS